MARRNSPSVCMLFGLGFGEVLYWAMDWLGSPSWAMDRLSPLSRPNLGGTISPKAWIWAGPSLFKAGLLLFGMGQSNKDVLSLDQDTSVCPVTSRAVVLVTGPHALTPRTHSQLVAGPGRTPE